MYYMYPSVTENLKKALVLFIKDLSELSIYTVNIKFVKSSFFGGKGDLLH